MASLDVSAVHQPRAYQIEMLHKSLQRNVIVAMDTGSGKTKVAVLRIEEELRRSQSDRIVWFLCPKVELAKQQHQVLKTQLPAIASLLLLAEDGVDFWSTKSIWDNTLHGYQVVVSTYQILLDALKHGMLSMSRFSLLVIDEAHHCTRRTPLNRIMQGFYFPAKNSGLAIPAILGLTATPVISGKAEDLAKVESNLDAISCTPKESLANLLEHVHRPEMIPVIFQDTPDHGNATVYQNFLEVFKSIEISEDPYVKRLVATNQTGGREYLEAADKKRTWCHKQLRAIESNATKLQREMGYWASSRYLSQCHQSIKIGAERTRLTAEMDSVSHDEYAWLLKLFAQAQVPGKHPDIQIRPDTVSNKLSTLLETLLVEMRGDSAAIIFCQTKAEVHYLFHFLRTLEETRKLLRIGTLVGCSSREKGKDMSEIREAQSQNDLNDLRAGKKNLLICTDVAEEGLDISACNLVVCFERPRNLKSFVQRRGRARKRDAKFMVFFDQTETSKINDFQGVEKEMKELYAGELRTLREKEELDNLQSIRGEIRSNTTSACITADDVVAHLHHFCAHLPRSRLGISEPSFVYTGPDGDVRCTLTLPNTVDASIRTYQSSKSWKSEQQAKKDVALLAYQRLYDSELVNDNLLPNPIIDSEVAAAISDIERRASEAQIEDAYDPMRILALAWAESSICYRYACYIPSHDLQLYMFLPIQLPPLPLLTLYLDKDQTTQIQFEFRGPCHTVETVEWASVITQKLLFTMFSSRMSETWNRFPVLFSPMLERSDTEQWLKDNLGRANIKSLNVRADDDILVQQRTMKGRPFIFRDFEDHEVSLGRDGPKVIAPCAKVMKWPARTDFMHPVPSEHKLSGDDMVRYMPVSTLVVEKISVDMAFCVSLIPSILHHVGRRVLAYDLSRNLLADAHIFDHELLLESITATAAREDADYQRVEFLGDSVLGFLITISLLAQYPLWHEGYLTKAKEHIVSNSWLARASHEKGLDRYILTKPFTGAKWTPPHNVQYEEPDQRMRSISTKTMADVLEAVIGVAYLEKGIPAAFDVIRILLGQNGLSLEWEPLDARIDQVKARVPALNLSKHLEPLQQLIGHSFEQPGLLCEAVNHNSSKSESQLSSYERLEFAGDSILSLLVTRLIFSTDPNMQAKDMHLLRTASVNGHFLAFMAFRLTVTVSRRAVVRPERVDKTKENSGYSTQDVDEHLSLYHFMSHYPSEAFTNARDASLERYHKYREAIEAELNAGHRYPWTLLASFAPEKFFSDLVESTLCAIFIDSDGDFEPCSVFLEKLGILAFIRHAISHGTHTLQPKQELGIVAGQQKVRYEMVSIRDEGLPGELEGDWKVDADMVGCRVFVGERRMATAVGRERFEAETRAAAWAIEVLKEEEDREVACDGEREGVCAGEGEVICDGEMSGM